jgi:hypothetical protein
MFLPWTGNAQPETMCLKKNLLILFLTIFQFVLITTSAIAQETESVTKFRVGICSGYGRENLNWSIAGKTNTSDHVNILSELDWKRLAGISFDINAEYNFYKRFILNAEFSALVIIDYRSQKS